MDVTFLRAMASRFFPSFSVAAILLVNFKLSEIIAGKNLVLYGVRKIPSFVFVEGVSDS